MTLDQVLALINQAIIANNNNEITANVLRPILIEMLQQPNDLIGVLNNLNTSANDNLVNAINEVLGNIQQVHGINISQGTQDPNLNSSLNPEVADFYSQVNVNNIPFDLWIYNGVKWVSLSMNYVSYENPQTISIQQKKQARDNINALDRQLSEVPNTLTTQEKDDFKNKLSIYDSPWGLKQW